MAKGKRTKTTRVLDAVGRAVDAAPFAHEQACVDMTIAAFKPGWCILHPGQREPCVKCNSSHHVEGEVTSRG